MPEAGVVQYPAWCLRPPGAEGFREPEMGKMHLFRAIRRQVPLQKMDLLRAKGVEIIV